jgi:hypothetical protein
MARQSVVLEFICHPLRSLSQTSLSDALDLMHAYDRTVGVNPLTSLLGLLDEGLEMS